jgi:hypothetical protein
MPATMGCLMQGDYQGMRYSVSPRRLSDGCVVWDASVMDGHYRPVWSHTDTSQEGGLRAALRWIDGTDRSVGFTHQRPVVGG